MSKFSTNVELVWSNRNDKGTWQVEKVKIAKNRNGEGRRRNQTNEHNWGKKK